MVQRFPPFCPFISLVGSPRHPPLPARADRSATCGSSGSPVRSALRAAGAAGWSSAGRAPGHPRRAAGCGADEVWQHRALSSAPAELRKFKKDSISAYGHLALRSNVPSCAVLVMSRDAKSMSAHSQATRSHKPYLRSTSIQCYLCLLLNSHFLTEAGIHIFILGRVSAGLPKTESNWQYVIKDLEKIENLIQSIHIDATLYTESSVHPNCKVTAMKCFLLELHVIWQESNNMDVRETIENLIILANKSLSSNGNVTESGCKECEELEEKNVKEFVRSFTHIVQMFINTS